MYILGGYQEPVFYPWFFAVVVSISMLINTLTVYRLLLIVQLTLIFVIPILLQYSLGGFVDSGGVIMWSMLAPIGSLLFQSIRSALNWFYAFLVTIFGMSFLEVNGHLPMPFVLLDSQHVFFTVNVIGMAITVFASMLYLSWAEAPTAAIHCFTRCCPSLWADLKKY